MLIDCKPLADDSNDHLHPWGAANDLTHCTPFVVACERFLGTRLAYLDLGCAGGGLVQDFIEQGHFAYGLEGSDTPRKMGRAPWVKYPGNFATCDISRPFRLSERRFDVISAWEVLEHIPEDRLGTLLGCNVYQHLSKHGIFVASISTKPDVVNGVTYHVTVQPEEWWRDMYHRCGLEVIDSPFSNNEYARTDGCSVHLVARRDE